MMNRYLSLFMLAALGTIVWGCKDQSTATPATPPQKKMAPATKAEANKTPAATSKESSAIRANGKNGIYTILILHNGESTDALHNALTPLAKDVGNCECLIAKADNAGIASLFGKQLDAAALPTPVAVAIAPNMMVTGVFMKPPGTIAFKEAILPEQPLAVREALTLNQKNVIVKIQSPKTAGNKETNKAIQEFLADPKAKATYVTVTVDLDKPENALFLQQLGVSPDKETQSIIIGMAPPLKIVNKPFRGAAKKLDVEKAVNPACSTGCGPAG